MSTAPGLLNLTFSQGATWKLAMTYTDAEGTPVDLSDYTARMQARTSYEAGTATLSLTNGTGIALGGTAGTIELLVPAAIDAPNLDRNVIRERAFNTYSLEATAPKYERYFQRLLTLWGDGWYSLTKGKQ